MAKFYVECGPVQLVLVAESAEHAALLAIDRALQVHAWIFDDQELADQDRRDHLMLEALLYLDPSIDVSERGFGRDDAQQVGTPETVDRWHRLMTGVNRLFEAAGLPPRAMAVSGSSSEPQQPAPRRPR